MTKPVVLNQRCKQLKRLLYARYGPTLPDDDAGREDLELVLGFTSDKRLASTITLLAPWMQGEAAGSLIDRVRSLPPDLRYLSPKKLGERVLLRHEERERHKLWQIEATDISNEVAAEMRKARRREALKRHRRNRGVRPRARIPRGGEKRGAVEGIERLKSYLLPSQSP